MKKLEKEFQQFLANEKKKKKKKYVAPHDQQQTEFIKKLEKDFDKFHKSGEKKLPKGNLSTSIGITFKYNKVWYMGGQIEKTKHGMKSDEQFVTINYSKGKKQDTIKYAIDEKMFEIKDNYLIT